MSVTLVILPICLSFLITAGILFVLFNKFFRRYIDLKNSGTLKLLSLLLISGLISLGIGISTILNELFYATLNQSEIKITEIEKGVFILIFYPLVLWSLGYLLRRFIAKSVQPTDRKTELRRIWKNNPLLLATLAVVSLLIFVFSNEIGVFTSSKLIAQRKDEKEFKLQTCNYCDRLTNQCNDSDLAKSMIVTSEKVVLILRDGSIMDTSQMSDMKCSIIPSKNFMFDCNSIRVNSVGSSSTKYKFDGESKFSTETHIENNNRIFSSGHVTCKVR